MIYWSDAMELGDKIEKVIKDYNFTRVGFIERLHNVVDEYYSDLSKNIYCDGEVVIELPYFYLTANRTRVNFGIAVPRLRGSRTLSDNGTEPLDVFEVIKYLSH